MKYAAGLAGVSIFIAALFLHFVFAFDSVYVIPKQGASLRLTIVSETDLSSGGAYGFLLDPNIRYIVAEIQKKREASGDRYKQQAKIIELSASSFRLLWIAYGVEKKRYSANFDSIGYYPPAIDGISFEGVGDSSLVVSFSADIGSCLAGSKVRYTLDPQKPDSNGSWASAPGCESLTPN